MSPAPPRPHPPLGSGPSVPPSKQRQGGHCRRPDRPTPSAPEVAGATSNTSEAQVRLRTSNQVFNMTLRRSAYVFRTRQRVREPPALQLVGVLDPPAAPSAWPGARPSSRRTSRPVATPHRPSVVCRVLGEDRATDRSHLKAPHYMPISICTAHQAKVHLRARVASRMTSGDASPRSNG